MSIVDKLPASVASVLVVSDLGFLLATIMRYSTDGIVFAANTVEQENEARSMGVRVFQLGYNDVARELKEKIAGMKFDIIVGNPPYGDLHLKILKECVEHLADDGVCVTIQPVRWLQDPLWNIKKSTDAKRYRKYFDGRLDSVEVISAIDACSIFGVVFKMDLGIFTIKNNGKFDYASLSTKPWGVDISSMIHLIKPGQFSHDLYDSSMQHFVPIVDIGGSSYKFCGWRRLHKYYGYFANGVSHECRYGNGLTLEEACNANPRKTNGKIIGSTVKAFSTAAEAKNYYGYITLPEYQFFVYVTTVDVNVHSSYLPFPTEADAFTTEWTSDRFCEYFGITQDQRSIIDSTMDQLDKNPVHS